MNREISLNDSQKRFVSFLVQNRVLLFGDFVTKSGRNSPFFLNFGMVYEGDQVQTLGELYAEWIVKEFGHGPFIIFGPAYKGIPLAVATVIGLAAQGCKASYLFNRKEAKTHGEVGMLVGKAPSPGETVLLVDDVVTAGTTLREVIPWLKELSKDAVFGGVVVGVDRGERGVSVSARREAEDAFGVEIRPIVSMKQIVAYLSGPNPSSKQLTPSELEACERYMTQYGAEDI